VYLKKKVFESAEKKKRAGLKTRSFFFKALKLLACFVAILVCFNPCFNGMFKFIKALKLFVLNPKIFKSQN